MISETSELLERLTAELKAIDRPTLEAPILASLRSGAYAAHAKAVREWEAANPVKAAAWADVERRLTDEDNRLSMLPFERAREAERARKLDELVGCRIVDALKAAHPTQALTAAKDWEASTSWCLALLGGVGNGKSVAAGWLVQRQLALRGDVVWLRAPEGAMRSLYGAEADSRARAARGASLLVVDDLGAEMNSDAWKCWLEDVIGTRYAHSDRTVLTSNLDAGALRLRMGDRLSDRIREGTIIGTDEPSLRRRPVLPLRRATT